MTSLLKSELVVRLWSRITGVQRRRPRVALRSNLEGLESRALLSAVGMDSLNTACDIQTMDSQTQGKAAVPRIDVAGTFDISGGDIGTGSVTITQDGLHIDGTFDTPNLIAGTFSAQFKKSKSHVAKGTAALQFTGDDMATNFKFTIRFKNNGSFSYRYR